MDKVAEYQKLVSKRKVCRLCAPTLTNTSSIERPRDCDRIGNYSLWQGNLSAQLVVVGQDSADVRSYGQIKDYIEGDYCWPDDADTNNTLVELVAEAGIKIHPTRVRESDDVIFATNGVLCLKQGKMGTDVLDEYFKACGKQFLGPLLDIIKPKVVATLGSQALLAMKSAYPEAEIDWSPTMTEIVNSNHTYQLPQGSVLVPMFHPSEKVLNTIRTFAQQKEDWRRLRQYFTQL